jgi:multidrug resistance efflux pump
VLKDAEVGEVVSPNVQGGSSARGSVVTMVDFASLEVQAEVPETSLAAVVVGRGASIYLDAFPEKAYAARVDRIWPTANRTKATVEVRVAFLERDERLRPEMGVRVVFEAEARRSRLSRTRPPSSPRC